MRIRFVSSDFVSSNNRNAMLCFGFTMVPTPLWLRKQFSKTGVWHTGLCIAGTVGSGLLGCRRRRVSVQNAAFCSGAPVGLPVPEICRASNSCWPGPGISRSILYPSNSGAPCVCRVTIHFQRIEALSCERLSVGALVQKQTGY